MAGRCQCDVAGTRMILLSVVVGRVHTAVGTLFVERTKPVGRRSAEVRDAGRSLRSAGRTARKILVGVGVVLAVKWRVACVGVLLARSGLGVGGRRVDGQRGRVVLGFLIFAIGD